MASAGKPAAQEMLAKLYGAGLGGLPRSEKLADEWHQRADKTYLELAARGDAIQQFHAAMIREGMVRRARWDDDQARHRAVFWFARSAQAGFPPAQAELARYLANGWGTQRDESQAAYWLALAKDYGFGTGGAATGKRKAP
jgi:TPR repeat protein